ncbi:MAG TPA: hypothetical protein VGC67_06230 [Cellulomonas sp.]
MSGWTHDDPGAGETAHLRTVAETMQHYRDALVGYANEVEDIDLWARRRRTERADAEQELADADRQQWAVQVPPLQALSTRSSIPGDRAAQARTAIAAAERALDDLEERRRSADQTLTAALVPLSVGGWDELGRTMSEAGLTRPDQITPAAVATTLGDALRFLIDNGASADPAAIAEAQALLAAWGDSPALMDALFDRLGGAGTAELMNLLGDLHGQGDDPTALATAVRLRDGLARASAGWDADRAAEFADGLMGSGRAGGVVAFLFDDGQPGVLGKELTIAMSERVDELERTHGAAWWATGASGAAALVPALHAEDPRHGVDPGGAVLGMLARYPDSALDWLTDPDLGDARIQYWYATRGGGLPLDGFAGVAALWESTFHATGGLDDPATADLDALSRWAGVSSQIMAALGGNPSYGTGTISPAGAASVATAIGDMLPILSQIPMQEDSDSYERDAVGFMVDASALYGMPVAYPFVEESVLAHLLGVAASQERGFAAYASGVRDAVQLNLTALDPRSSDYGEDASDMLQRVAAMLGLSQGAQVGVQITEDVRDAVAQQMYWQTATAVAGLVPVGVPGLTGAAAAMAGMGVSLAQSAGSSALAPADPITVVSSALGFAKLGEDDRIDGVRGVLTDLADEMADGYRQANGTATDAERMRHRVDEAVQKYRETSALYVMETLREGL